MRDRDHSPVSGCHSVLCALCVVVSAAYSLPTSGADAKKTNLADTTIHADQPYTVTFKARRAKFVRILIHRSSRGQPCIDELEVYGPDGRVNLALETQGAHATASSCLPGYAIHRIQHLNDGRYGNSHSWIAAGTSDEWVQIELPAEAQIASAVVSRDRDGKYHDRVPVAFEIRLSSNGRDWRTVRELNRLRRDR